MVIENSVTRVAQEDMDDSEEGGVKDKYKGVYENKDIQEKMGVESDHNINRTYI